MVRNNLALVERDRGYRFTGNEHELLQAVRDVLNEADLPTIDVWERVYDATHEWLSPRTITNLRTGKTRRPHLRTCTMILAGFGKRLEVRS